MFHVRIYGLKGELLVQTWNKGSASKDMEIDAALSRSDVSRVEWWGDGKGYDSNNNADLVPLTTVRK